MARPGRRYPNKPIIIKGRPGAIITVAPAPRPIVHTVRYPRPKSTIIVRTNNVLGNPAQPGIIPEISQVVRPRPPSVRFILLRNQGSSLPPVSVPNPLPIVISKSTRRPGRIFTLRAPLSGATPTTRHPIVVTRSLRIAGRTITIKAPYVLPSAVKSRQPVVVSSSTRRAGRILNLRPQAGGAGAFPTTPRAKVVTSSIRKLGRIILHRQPYVAPVVIPPTFACIHVYDQLSTSINSYDKQATTINTSEKVC